MEAYLDNSATTVCYEEVKDAVANAMLLDYGNPSSMHRKGMEAENLVKDAVKTLAGLLKVKEKEIYLTSGGTESDNWALYGAALANSRMGKHIITTEIEHAAVASPAAFLESKGYEVTRLKVDERGLISKNELEAAIRPDTILVSIMYVNNEIGSVQPIAEIGEMIKAKNPKTLFHVDAIQAFGKFRIYPARMKVDMLSVSGHKIHGPKGTGFLYIAEKAKVSPLILGGGQQGGMRSGTDNVPGAVGLAVAAKKIYADPARDITHMLALQKRLVTGLAGLEKVIIHGPCRDLISASSVEAEIADAAPHIVNASFLGVRSEVLLHTLEDRGIYVSAGSACSSHKRAPSATLKAIGCSKEELESAVRFSFCELTTEEEIDYTLEVLSEVLPILRKYTRR